MRNLNVREMGKSLEVKCCVKITVSMVGYPGIPEEVVYWRANLTIGLLEKWRWYFDYLAALVKVANPKRSVRLTAGRQDVLVGQEYVEEKTRTLLIGKRRVLSRLDRQTDDDLFGFTSADRERKRQRIMKEIEELEARKIISGYQAVINWDNVDDDRVTALIGVKISPVRGQGFDRIAERISRFEEVGSVMLMSGSSADLILTIEGNSMKEVSQFVYDKIAPMESVVSTATYFVMKKYKDHGILFTEEQGVDERIQIMP